MKGIIMQVIQAAELNQKEAVKRIGASIQPHVDKVLGGDKVSAKAEECAKAIIESGKGALQALVKFALGIKDVDNIDPAAKALQQSLDLKGYSGSKVRSSEFRAVGYARFVDEKAIKALPDLKVTTTDKDGKDTVKMASYHDAIVAARKLREDGVRTGVLDEKYAPKTAPVSHKAPKVTDKQFEDMLEKVKALSATQWAAFLPAVEAEKAQRDRVNTATGVEVAK